jgi:hypothetical protein
MLELQTGAGEKSCGREEVVERWELARCSKIPFVIGIDILFMVARS